MANTLTNLIPAMYAALNVVSRELIGFIPAVTRGTKIERAALNQKVYVPLAPAATNEADNTPAAASPDTGDQTIGNVEVTISKSKHVPVRWNGEEEKGLENAGTFAEIMQQRFEQAFRRLTNLIEVDVASTYKSASRAYGTAGTTPFGTAGDFSDAAQVRLILDDNGAPQTDLQLVLGNTAMANLRGKQSSLFKVNEAGSDRMLREGRVDLLEGFALRASGQVALHTKGTGASYLINNGAGYAAGSTALTVDTGTGTIVAGDVLTAAGNTDKHIVGTALAANVVTLNQPGLRAAVADDVALTVGNSYRANMAFSRSAIVLATRLPAMSTKDAATDRTIVVDPISGLAFEIALYPQFGQVSYHVRIAWGWSAIRPEHIAVLLG